MSQIVAPRWPSFRQRSSRSIPPRCHTTFGLRVVAGATGSSPVSVEVIMPAPTVSFAASSTSTKLPVARLRR